MNHYLLLAWIEAWKDQMPPRALQHLMLLIGDAPNSCPKCGAVDIQVDPILCTACGFQAPRVDART